MRIIILPLLLMAAFIYCGKDGSYIVKTEKESTQPYFKPILKPENPKIVKKLFIWKFQ